MSNFEKLDNEQKELVKLWIEKYREQVVATGAIISISHDFFVEKYLTPDPIFEINEWYFIERPDYSGEKNALIFTSDKENWYGFGHSGSWTDVYGKDIIGYKFTKATKEEVTEHLIEEAKKRGFEKDALTSGFTSNDPEIINGTFFTNNPFSELCVHTSGSDILGHCIYKNGEWAEIIDPKQEIRDQISWLEQQIESLKLKI